MAHVWQIDPNPGRNQPYANQQLQTHSHEAAAGGLLSLADAAGQQSQSNQYPSILQDEQHQTPPPMRSKRIQIQDTTPPDPGAFQCGFCKKSYTRPDHLIRHVRSHTQEKPYVCPVCQKGFARPDLVKRHAAAHNDQNQGPDHSNKKKRLVQTPSASRVTQACKACASSKLKCTEEKPCKRCQQKGWNCEYSYTDGNHSPGTSGAADDQNQTPVVTATTQPFDHSGTQLDFHQNDNVIGSGQLVHTVPHTVPTTDGSYRSTHVPTPETFNQHAIDPNLTIPPNDGILEFDGVYYPDFLRELMMPNSNAYSNQESYVQGYPKYMSPSLTTHGFMGYDTGSSSTESYNNGDYSTFDHPAAYDYQFNANSDTSNDGMNSEHSTPASQAALGAEAFKKSSLGEWVPTAQDHCYSEEVNLSLPDQAERTIEIRQSSEQRITKSSLALSNRDKMLSLILGVCKPDNVNRVVSSFPSAGLFDSLMQMYLRHHIQQVDTWFHFPTLDPNNAPPELITAVAGAGAVRTDLVSVQKLGYALQESLRNSLAMRFEQNNTRARSLQFHQAYFLQLEVRLWSAVGRKTELAEAFLQPGVTMIRRGRKFKLSGGSPVMPEPEDEGQTLQTCWLAWAEQESRKRLSLHVFLHDAQSSITLNVNPLISYAELTLPLPCSLDLWQAPDAATWKRLILSKEVPPMCDPKFAERQPNLPEVLKDMSLLSAFAGVLDIQLSRLIVLHALWALIWEHRQLNTLACGQSGPWSTLVLSSRHREISVAIQNFRINSTNPPLAPEVHLMLECINMHLYMSLDELQLYAGKEDPRDAQQAYHSARNWIASPSSRQAIWHAGQVVRAARSMRPHTLRDFYAVAVYHASLAFWSYGIVNRAMTNQGDLDADAGGSFDPLQQEPIYLDGDETLDSENWISHKGRWPLLSMPGTTAPAFPGRPKDGRPDAACLNEETTKVMEVVRGVLSDNWNGKGKSKGRKSNGKVEREQDREPAPPLVENLCQLMGDLGRAAAGRD
ncbi:MAG: hypothetical protein Q9160_001811 [Pyrenula sp. 1 TL-2023]